MSNEPVKFLPLGASIQKFEVNGINIVQGFDTQEQYVKYNAPYFGETIGRVANRVGGAQINNLNGKSYPLAVNNGPNSLHGGVNGWGKQVWERSDTGKSVTFTIKSKDGDEGYPGTVAASVEYTTTVSEDKKTTLVAKYKAELVGDEVEETVINLTNHSYFNLSGQPTIDGTEVTLYTDIYLPVDDGGIPNDLPKRYEVGPGHSVTIVPGQKFTLGVTDPDIDDCFVVPPPNTPSQGARSDTVQSLSTAEQPLSTLIDAYHPSTKIHLRVSSTEPAFQFYTGKYIDVPEVTGNGKTLPARGRRSGFCVEPSRFVNAVNVPGWRDQVILKKGQIYTSTAVYEAWVDEA
ncbi:putative bifunctional protein gal10 [Bisporella sp. PMI_857]|nr:putative bifunctional protein gal10 [Bisporella sp. PMI_857]